MAEMNADESISSYVFENKPRIRVGLGIAAFIAILSTLAALGLLVDVLTRYSRLRRDRETHPVSVLFVFWVLMDAVQGLGGAFNMKWAFDGRIEDPSAFCTAQAVLEQISDDGAASCVIGISVLVLLQLTKPALIEDRLTTIAIVAPLIIIFILIMIILVPATVIDGYYGNTGLWCWIVNRNGTTARLQIGAEYIFFWLGALLPFVLYGYILFKKLMKRSGGPRTGIRRPLDTISVGEAMNMLWYSIAYIVEIIPISIIRFKQFHNPESVSHGWAIFATSVLMCSGAVNVILWFATGRRYGFQ